MYARMSASILVSDPEVTVQLDGAGNCIEIEDGVAAIGSGGLYALSAARGMIDNESLCAKEIAQRSMRIAGDLCIYTNHNTTIEVLKLGTAVTDDETKSVPVIGYWDVRGKGAQVYYILAYCGVKYEAKTYIRGAAPEFSKSDWTKERDSLGLDFPNLPYLIDGDFKLTESKSIMKYVAARYEPDLLGSTAEEVARVDMMSRVHDTLYDQIGVHFKKGDPTNFALQITIVGQILSTHLGRKPFAIGENLTFVDFCLFELMDFMNHYSDGATFATYSNLREHHERMVALPRFADAWANDTKLRKWPYKYGQMAIN